MLGQVAVEAGAHAGPGILGQVDDAGALVDGDGLVAEPPHRRDRARLVRLAGTAPERDLEAVAVALGEAQGGVGVFGSADGLLAADPAVQVDPTPAGAVDRRARQADVRAQQASRAGVVVERRHAAAGLRVVLARVGGHAARARRVAVLVVAHQPHRAARPGERRHAVERERGGVAVAHRRADVAERHVAESGREREHLDAALVGHRGERPVALTRPGMAGACRSAVGGPRGPGGHPLERDRAQHRAAGGDGAAAQEVAPIHRGHVPASSRGR